MSEETIRVSNGTEFYKLSASSLNNSKGIPTNHYTTTLELITELGHYLDTNEQKDQLKGDLESLMTYSVETNRYNIKNAFLTDGINHYFLLDTVNDTIGKKLTKVPSVYDWVVDIIKKIGYLNQPYEKNKNSIKFTLASKNNLGEIIELILYPIDNYNDGKNTYLINKEN